MKPFVPPKLPITNKLNILYFYKRLIEASTNLGKYQVILQTSKIEPDLLLNPLAIKEAVQSTKIEGTQATLDEVLEAEVDDSKNKNDIAEVLNYYRALKHGEAALRRLPISGRLIKEIHQIILSKGVRGSNRNPGQFRTVQNYLGPEGCTSYVPPEPQLINDYIANLEQYINEAGDELHPLVRAAIIHAQFETIHPFLDGNGRVGRILIPLYLYAQGVLDSPNLFISEELERDKYMYYSLLNATRFKEEWDKWIAFFLEAVNRHKISELTGISYSSCRRYLNTLVEENIIFTDGKTRGRKYYYYHLLDLIR